MPVGISPVVLAPLPGLLGLAAPRAPAPVLSPLGIFALPTPMPPRAIFAPVPVGPPPRAAVREFDPGRRAGRLVLDELDSARDMLRALGDPEYAAAREVLVDRLGALAAGTRERHVRRAVVSGLQARLLLTHEPETRRLIAQALARLTSLQAGEGGSSRVGALGQLLADGGLQAAEVEGLEQKARQPVGHPPDQFGR